MVIDDSRWMLDKQDSNYQKAPWIYINIYNIKYIWIISAQAMFSGVPLLSSKSDLVTNFPQEYSAIIATSRTRVSE